MTAKLQRSKGGLEKGAASTDSQALSVRSLSKNFGHRHALSDVSFDLPQGAFLTVFGPNGAGKSTLLRIVSTLSAPTSGSVLVMGCDIREDAERARRMMGVIGHESMLYADLTAEENLMFFARMYGVADPRTRVLESLRAVELDHRRLDLVREFSRGMTQRLSIARALLSDPPLVILDEPYSGLDPHAVEILDGIIGGIRKDHTMIMVSHDPDKGLALASHVLVLARGRVVLFTPRDELDVGSFMTLYHDTVGAGVA